MIPRQSILMKGVTRAYGKIRALDDITLEFAAGQCHCLIGPNGAGKSTLLHSILGLCPVRGRLEVNGVPVTSNRRWRRVSDTIGFAAQTPELYPHLTARENLEFLGQMRRVGPPLQARIGVWLNRFGVGDEADRLVRGLSLGTRKKVSLAAAVLHAPSILLLDEPTAGLDARGVHAVVAMVRDLSMRGGLCLMSTHALEAAGPACDRIVLMNQGRITRSGQAEDIRRWMQGRQESPHTGRTEPSGKTCGPCGRTNSAPGAGSKGAAS